MFFPPIRRDISKTTSVELPKALEVCLEETPKQCDPRGSQKNPVKLRHVKHSGFLNVLAPVHFYNNVFFLIGNLIFLTPGLLIRVSLLSVCLDPRNVLTQNAELHHM